MQFYKLQILAQHLSGALGTGKYHDIPYEEVWRCIDDGTIFNLLRHRVGLAELNTFLGAADRTELLIEWSHMREAVPPDTRFGTCPGITLLLDYVVQSMVYRAGKNYRGMVPEWYDAAMPCHESDILK